VVFTGIHAHDAASTLRVAASARVVSTIAVIMIRPPTAVAIAALLLAGCSRTPELRRSTTLPSSSLAAPTAATSQPDPSLDPALDAKPLYQFSEAEIDVYLNHVRRAEPDLRKRVVAIARKNIGQPYKLYLLGEAPFETIDPEPVYCLHHSDCVVFVEHTLAMALSDSWQQFLEVLQRIRYKDGHISVLTRNHYTEADWNPHNAWLVRDSTAELASAAAETRNPKLESRSKSESSNPNDTKAPARSDEGGEMLVRFEQTIDRARFFRNRYKLDDVSFDVQAWHDTYIPHEHVGSIKVRLRDADIVNFVSGRGSDRWVGHVGLVALAADGAVNLIHSADPAVREEPIDDYIRRTTRDADLRESSGKARFVGFKFLRLHNDPWSNLRELDGPSAPHVSVPANSPVTFEEYVRSFQEQM
jgi:hypothetical protein